MLGRSEHLRNSKALAVVDVQRDFCEGGALAAQDTSSLLQPLNIFIGDARQRGELVVFTQDWHPNDHLSFKQNGGPWPIHCVAESLGAELAPPLVARLGDLIIRKGISRDDQGYSMFEHTRLANQLQQYGVSSVGVCGIATEYCVRATALDAIKAGFDVAVLTDLIRPIDPSDAASAISELAAAGAHVATSKVWLSN